MLLNRKNDDEKLAGIMGIVLIFRFELSGVCTWGLTGSFSSPGYAFISILIPSNQFNFLTFIIMYMEKYQVMNFARSPLALWTNPSDRIQSLKDSKICLEKNNNSLISNSVLNQAKLTGFAQEKERKEDTVNGIVVKVLPWLHTPSPTIHAPPPIAG